MQGLTVDNHLRTCRFRPYRAGWGPTFTLDLWNCERRDHLGKWILGYRLTMRYTREQSQIIFESEDFGCSPCHAVDSDETVKALMGFLTLRPGDTDREYFASYTPEQLEYCAQHAEALDAEVRFRFGD